MMDYTFPAVKFVKTNTDIQQVNHVFSEIKEMLQECKKEVTPSGLVIKDYNDHFIKESVDLYHSLETLFRIWRKQGIAVEDIEQKVFEKNRERGYYDD